MNKATIYFPKIYKGIKVYEDADFSGNWNKEDTENTETPRSRHGFVIYYKGCPIDCKSSLQTNIDLPRTEIDYTGLAYALRETIHIMRLLKYISSMGFTEGALTQRVAHV